MWGAKPQAQTKIARVAGLPNQMIKDPEVQSLKLECLKRRFCIPLITLILSFCFVFPVFFSKLHAQSLNLNLDEDYDSLVVVPKGSIQNVRRTNLLFRKQGILRYQKINDSVYVVPLDKSEDKKAKILNLQNSGLFKLIEPDYRFSLDQVQNERNYVKVNVRSDNDIRQTGQQSEVTPNDKDFSSQYYLRQINALKAWNTTTGDELIVGVLDTGADETHPELIGKIVRLGESAAGTEDGIGHGTEVSGIIAANTNNSQGIAGISWKTKILPVKVTDEFGQAKVSSVVKGLDEAYEYGVKIVQISLSTSQFSQVLKDAVKLAQGRNILIISTGGNTGAHELRYPAAFDGVIGVGAVTKDEEVETYSTTGNHISLVAPGTNIYTTSLLSSYVSVSGTSFAAPQVAGAAALVWSVMPELSWRDVREILISSAKDLGEKGKDFVYGYGLLDVETAVMKAKARQNDKLNDESSENFVIESWLKR